MLIQSFFQSISVKLSTPSIKAKCNFRFPYITSQKPISFLNAAPMTIFGPFSLSFVEKCTASPNAVVPGTRLNELQKRRRTCAVSGVAANQRRTSVAVHSGHR